MIVLGLLLILVAIGVTVFVVIAPTATSQIIEVPAGAITVSTSPLAMFLAGAASLVLLGLGYALISGGTRRKARSRKELRQLRKDQAAPGASTHPEGGHRSSRTDRSEKESSSKPSTDGSKELQPERHPDPEPHSSA